MLFDLSSILIALVLLYIWQRLVGIICFYLVGPCETGPVGQYLNLLSCFAAFFLVHQL